MACPCVGPSRSVRKISKSKVPCNNSIRSLRSLVDILGESNRLPVECQGVRVRPEWFARGVPFHRGGAALCAPSRQDRSAASRFELISSGCDTHFHALHGGGKPDWPF